ncbi:signal peptidase complex subunit SPC3 [Aspergillus stella-maris]|uniref:signal peptidase complex subunit SPC3 n=1 Tax=Aspergillus stella-maris TaxID=1810926 RepID=UPI003CCD4759
MHSTIYRAQAVFGFFTTVALFVAGFAALSVLFFPTSDVTSDVRVKDVKVIKGRPHYYAMKKEEYAQMRFDLDADLSPLFNWNTKQLFVYVYATYSSSENPSPNTPITQSIIWDTIIEAPESPYSVANLRERFLGTKNTRAQTTKKNTKNSKDKTGVLRLRDQKSKYQISDITGHMAERQNVTLSVGWNVQPWVGALFWAPGTGAFPHTEGSTGGKKAFDLPALKVAKKTATATASTATGTVAVEGKTKTKTKTKVAKKTATAGAGETKAKTKTKTKVQGQA